MKFLRAIILIMLFSLSACSSLDLQVNGPASNDHLNELPIHTNGDVLKAEISHIIDGDTISILTSSFNLEHISDAGIRSEIENAMNEKKKVNVRFLAIDTPEITNGKAEWFGQEARDVVDFMLSDDEVLLEIDEQALFDNYGRMLAHVYSKDGESIQLALLETGLARIAYLYDDYEHVSDYQEAESKAKAEKLNIHSVDGYVTGRGFNMDVVDKEMLKQTMTLEEIIELLLTEQ